MKTKQPFRQQKSTTYETIDINSKPYHNCIAALNCRDIAAAERKIRDKSGNNLSEAISLTPLKI